MGESFQILPDQSQFGPDSLEWYFLSIREKDKWILSMGGERCLLLKRRYEGVRCPKFDEIRHTSAQHEDEICLGTGWIASNANMSGTDIGGPYHGYFAPVEIVCSFLTSGPTEVQLTDYGQQQVHRLAHNWTLWEPLLTPGDLIIRRDNTRYFVTQVFPHRFKHYVTHQDFDMSEIERGSIVYTLNLGI